ncbi:hypothetical protein [Planctobacterium marinum]|uniref:hypothetical protein n=1 Tax=Planctobacterium marinum TaxID=1631968 RepID=UPI001E550DFA|nr:hypothetical protein [Planctobacterium marinum]MCC2605417.1 hypothetical protein [Planctobacterium marinum]
MKNIKLFGNIIVGFNLVYCFFMAAFDALNNNFYIFLSDYFIAAALLGILALNYEIYGLVKKQKLADEE